MGIKCSTPPWLSDISCQHLEEILCENKSNKQGYSECHGATSSFIIGFIGIIQGVGLRCCTIWKMLIHFVGSLNNFGIVCFVNTILYIKEKIKSPLHNVLKRSGN